MKAKTSFVMCYIVIVGLFLTGTLLGNRAVTVFAERRPVERLHCIVIDAGHGGEDGGATSCTGLPESRFNLEIALKVNDLFRLLGYDTCMIRTTDTAVYTTGSTIAQKKVSDLKERVRIANETENGILVSIHQNTFSDSRYSGAQIFYADTEGSAALAKAMQEEFATTLNPGSNRQCKAASGVYLMENIRCTGILVECGFLSNPEEEAKLRSGEYQKKLCCVIACCVSTYLN